MKCSVSVIAVLWLWCISIQVVQAQNKSESRPHYLTEEASPKEVLNALYTESSTSETLDSLMLSKDSLWGWANAYGTAEELAMAKYVLFMRTHPTRANTYKVVVSGNDFWESHRVLPLHIQMTGLSKLQILYRRLHRFEENLTVTLRYCEVRSEYENLPGCGELAKVYYDLKQYDMALKHYRLNVGKYNAETNVFMEASSYNNMGNTFELLGEVDSARWAYDVADQLLLDSIGSSIITDPAYYRYFRDIVRWNKASLEPGFEPVRDIPEILQHVVATARLRGEPLWALKGYRYYKQWHYDNGNDELAKAYVDSAMTIASNAGLITELPDLIRFKAQLRLLKGDKVGAQQHLDRAQHLSDSLQAADSYLQGIVAAAFHKAQERERDLQASNLRAEHASALADSEKKQRQLYTGLFVLVALVLGVVAWLFRRTLKDRMVIKKQQVELEASLGEKEILLKEIHHRVKNNLQVISSLLDLQTGKTDDEVARFALEEGKSRVQSIAILHHQLYQNENLASVELGAFATELMHQIMGVFKKPEQKVSTRIEVEGCLLDIDAAVPMGLILNELITNSFKYAFDEVEKGLIEMRLVEVEDDGKVKRALVYQDNGPGLPPDLDIANAQSLGLRLISKLSKQFKGSSTYRYDDGAEFTIRF